jgi:hypothetical protein
METEPDTVVPHASSSAIFVDGPAAIMRAVIGRREMLITGTCSTPNGGTATNPVVGSARQAVQRGIYSGAAPM